MPLSPERLARRRRRGRRRRRRRRPAGQLGSLGSGRRALAASERTLPGVSEPSSVVRSTIEMAVSIAQAFAVVLIDRVPSIATRASAPTWSTPGRPCRKARKAASERVTSSYGGSGAVSARASSGSASGSSTWVMRPSSSPLRASGLERRRSEGWRRPASAADVAVGPLLLPQDPRRARRGRAQDGAADVALAGWRSDVAEARTGPRSPARCWPCCCRGSDTWHRRGRSRRRCARRRAPRWRRRR